MNPLKIKQIYGAGTKSKKTELPLLPVLHGTQFAIAWKIATTGFAALSSLDAGYFGKGVYFTSSCKYSYPYTKFGPNPCMILSFVNPGNIYPVIENHQSDFSLLGSAIIPGYNSHYIRTTKDGCCLSQPSNNSFDEFVMEQEAQIVPVVILELNPDASKHWQSRMQRELANKEQSNIPQNTSASEIELVVHS